MGGGARSLLYLLAVLLAFLAGVLVGTVRSRIATQGGVLAPYGGGILASLAPASAQAPAAARPAPAAAAPAQAPAAAGPAAGPEPAAGGADRGPAGGGQPQWCSQHASEEEVFECCFKEREGYKDLLAERGVNVKGKTEAYGTWGAAAKDEIRLLFEMLRATELTAARGKPFTVCETGFNWGGTSHIFLCASRLNATVLSFDIEKARSAVPNQALIERYGARMKLTIGDSAKVLSALAKSEAPPDCDFVYVDGGHSKASAKADMVNFAKMSRPGTPVVADDCYAEGSLKPGGPKQAFNDMIKEKVIDPQPSIRFKDLDFRMVCMGTYLGPPAG